LLARTQAFVASATAALDAYRPQELTRLFEAFVDDLSNWYIRTNRRRFWKATNTDDQRAAYGVLFTSLRTAAQVMAPVLPFLTEHVWQHLVRPLDGSAVESVHLAGWPESLSRWEDQKLLDQVTLVRRIIDAGRQLRTSSNLRIRMPLKALLVAGDGGEPDALRTFEEVVQRELNVRRIEETSVGRLRSRRVELSAPVAGPALGPDFPAVRARLDSMDPTEMDRLADRVQSASPGSVVEIGPALVPVEALILLDVAPEGLVVTSADGVAVALDVRLDRDLVVEGAIRDLIRQVQVMRKEVGMRVEQRIDLGVGAESADLREAIERFREAIMEETLAVTLTLGTIDLPMAAKQAELELGPAFLTLNPHSVTARRQRR
jgi:isoleucyl-tRNA synthetase